MVSGTRCPYVSLCKNVMVRGAAAPEGQMTYDSTQGNFLRFLFSVFRPPKTTEFRFPFPFSVFRHPENHRIPFSVFNNRATAHGFIEMEVIAVDVEMPRMELTSSTVFLQTGERKGSIRFRRIHDWSLTQLRFSNQKCANGCDPRVASCYRMS